MQSISGWRAAVFFVSVCALGVSATVWLSSEPNIQTASMSQIGFWLASHDLKREPELIHVALVNRLQDEILTSGFDGGDSGLLTNSKRRQLFANAELLKRTWFEERSAELVELKGPQRIEFLDRQIATVRSWPELNSPEETTQTELGDEHSTTSAKTGFFDELANWIRDADALQQQQMQTGVRLGLVRWLCTHSLDTESFEVRVYLVECIVDSLSASNDGTNGSRGESSDVRSLVDEATPEQQRKFQNNSQLLLQTWFVDSAQTFAQLPEDERTRYVDGLLQQIANCQLQTLLQTKTTSKLQSGIQLMAKIEGWIQATDDQQKHSVREFATSLQTRYLFNAVRAKVTSP